MTKIIMCSCFEDELCLQCKDKEKECNVCCIKNKY